jgi:hypothetical protein
MVDRGAAEMIHALITAMLASFAVSTILGCIVATLILKGHVYTAALITVVYLVSCLGMVIYALT